MESLAAYHILPAGPGDAAALARVHVRSWRETYDGLLPAAFLAQMNGAVYARRWRAMLMRPEPPELVLCAEGARGVVGYCAGSKAGGAAQVSTLYILKVAQGRGLGRRLLGSVARVMAAQGASSLRLWVLNGNDGARAFYERLGGAPRGERAVGGWGGGHRETAYDWPDIDALVKRAAPPAN
jgi:ribosomal protein S18 acetylase RimI-like enzyme